MRINPHRTNHADSGAARWPAVRGRYGRPVRVLMGAVAALSHVLSAAAQSAPVTSAAAASPAASSSPRVERALSDSAELDRVVDLYFSGQYEKCTDDLGRLLEAGTPGAFVEPRAVERGRLYFASCALLSGHADRARSALRAALEANPLMAAPDSLTFPPPLLALFFEVREELQSLISKQEQEQVARLLLENAEVRKRAKEREEREKQLLKLASEQPVVVQSSRFVAWLPYGAGQYQNGDTTLGHTFLVSELVMTATAVTSATILLDLYSQLLTPSAEPSDEPGDEPGDEPSDEPSAEPSFRPNGIPKEDVAKFQAAQTVMTISTYALLGTLVLGILEANLNFKQERQVGTKKRELPSPLSEGASLQLRPFAFPTNGGFAAGISGTF